MKDTVLDILKDISLHEHDDDDIDILFDYINMIIENLSEVNYLELYVIFNDCITEKIKQDKKSSLEFLRNRVKILLTRNTQIQQKSEEWLRMRNQMITASDIHTALHNKKFFILKKCNHGDPFNGNEATRWGEMFEPIAAELYSKKMNVIIHNFGLLQHEKYLFIGASPDGITSDGKLIEIKCPFSRQINNKVPTHYLPQVQTQLEVCDLYECDFIQCSFKLVDETYVGKEEEEIGAIGILKVKNQQPTERVYKEYIYTFFHEKEKMKHLIETRLKEKDTLEFEAIVYWRLDVFSIITIPRDREWWSENLDELKNTWNAVLYHRKNGIESLLKPLCVFDD